MRQLLCLLLGTWLGFAAPNIALAHKTNLTIAEVGVSHERVSYRLHVSAHDLAVALGIETDLVTPVPRTAFEGRKDTLARYLSERLTVLAQGGRCLSESPAVDYSRLPESLVVDLNYTCAKPVERLTISYGLFFDIDPTHRSLGRVIFPGGHEEFLFDRFLTRLELDVSKPLTQSSWTARFGRIFILGVEHILTGYDHILFLLALLIVSPRFWQLAKIVTAFTVAHSFTLALAWYGVIELPSQLVESLIAISIAYVATENLFREGFAHRWLLAGGLGLVHGLGFYSALSKLGLGTTDATTTLLAFNLGVEAGQLAIVSLLYGPLAWWVRQRWYLRSARVCSTIILLVAAWWIIERVLGI